MKHPRRSLLGIPLLLASLAALVVLGGFPGAALADGSNSFLKQFKTVSNGTSTVPDNGDQNPYGVAVVPKSNGSLVRGNVLVSNFNDNGANGGLQGRGTTIVQISPDGTVSLFAQLDAKNLPGACPGGVGLTTALVVLQRGWVIVGSLPTKDGMSATMMAGCLIVLNSQGQAVETFSGGEINGPWDMTAADWGDDAALFVTNVLNGTVAASPDPNHPNVVNEGTVLRITLEVPYQGYGNPRQTSTKVIGSGFPERTDPAALVIGPTGVGLSWDDTLYVADSVGNRIAAIPDALTRQHSAGDGRTVTKNGSLNDPLGLTIAPNGNILTANGNDGNIVETTPDGNQVFAKLVDNTNNTGAGCLFGLAIIGKDRGVYFVDDCDNTLKTLT